jgi:UDP-2,4-diacetamido-2,4,6-trideoxy-beta-L-altropyranose hydrolase
MGLQSKRVILRADGNGKIGYGHLSRLNAFAEMISQVYELIFIISNKSDSSLINKNYKVVKIPESINFNNEINWINSNFSPTNHIIIADGYNFNSNYQSKIKKIGYKLIYIDDLLSYHMYADCVINHAIGVDENKYFGENYVKYFLGSSYALMRQSFIDNSQSIKKKEIKLETAFVSFGGTNASEITHSVVEALIDFENIKKIIVVIGSSFSDSEIIDFFNREKKVELFKEVDEKLMSSLMNCSDIAIVPSSTIAYELASSRCLIASGYTVQNQFHIYEGLRKNNIIFGMGNITNFDKDDFKSHIKKIISSKKELLESKLQSQINYFDGKQKERLIEIVNSLI